MGIDRNGKLPHLECPELGFPGIESKHLRDLEIARSLEKNRGKAGFPYVSDSNLFCYSAGESGPRLRSESERRRRSSRSMRK